MKPFKQMNTSAKPLNQMQTNARSLNEEEKCELISALANARVNNNKKAKTFKSAAQDAHHKEDAADLSATAERYEMWGQLDESLIEAIRDGKLVIIGGTEDISEEDTED